MTSPAITLLSDVELDARIDTYRQVLGDSLGASIGEGVTLGAVWRVLLRAADGMMHLGGKIPMIADILAHGTYAGASDVLTPGIPRHCHWNAAHAAMRGEATAWTGFAFTAEFGLWVEHSWLVDAQGRTLETTTARDLYFGIPLRPEQVGALIGDNYGDLTPHDVGQDFPEWAATAP